MSKKVSSKIKRYPLVVFGAGVGGADSMRELLPELHPGTGLTYFYTQPPEAGDLSQLLPTFRTAAPIRVEMARNGQFLEADCLYLVPPEQLLTISDGKLQLSDRNDGTQQPVDRLLTSLARTEKERLIGVLLSGEGTDGVKGLREIKAISGFAFVQDGSSPFAELPRTAEAEGAADQSLSLPELGAELRYLGRQLAELGNGQLRLQQLANAASPEDIEAVLQLIHKGTGVSFSQYKMNTVERRIIRRMLLHKLTDLPDYLEFLRQQPGEVHALYQDMLINVTSFFRDAETLDYLQQELLPKMLEHKSVHDPLRIWVPACSTGEEAYSLAMIVLDLLGEKAAHTSVQIFATDLSETVIVKARQAVYSAADVANIPPDRLRRYFDRTDSHYQIIKPIRDLCVFAPHNLMKDPPFSRLDLVSCCNLLIYLDNPLQKKAIQTFHYALNPDGYLVLGKSEGVSNAMALFTQVDKKAKVFQKKQTALRHTLQDIDYRVQERTAKPPLPAARKAEPNTAHPVNLDKIIDNLFLSQFVPASVIVNHDYDILQFRGTTSLFLEPPPGRASLNLLKMANAALVFELRNALAQCRESGAPVKRNGLELKGSNRRVNFEVLPLEVPAYEPLLLVIFHELNLEDLNDVAAMTSDRRARQLENELIALREEMRIMMQEQETANEELQSANEEIISSNEELQSANEEIISSNEELQSINEELETSKEEIESTNEELMTINAELMVRNDQLVEAQEYTDAVIATIREAVLILDTNFHIRSANKAFFDTFRIREHHLEGASLFEIADGQWNIPRLRELLHDLTSNMPSYDGLEISHHFPKLGEKVLVINARRVVQKMHRQQFILLAIEDITQHRQNERLVAEREAWLRHMTDNVPALIWVAGPERQFTYVNKTWLAYTGRSLEQETGNGWMEPVHRDDLVNLLETYNRAFETKQPFRLEYRLRRHDGQYRWVQCHAVPSYDADGRFTGFNGSCTEVHDARIMNEELEKRVAARTADLQEANASLARSNQELEQFAFVASHDLQEPLRKIMAFSDRLQEKFGSQLSLEGVEYLTKIEKASDRMRHLIDDLLNFSKIVSARLEFVPTDLNALLQEVLTDFETTIREQNAILTIGPLPELEVLPVQVQQLFHNLVSNALKFTRAGVRPEIRIWSRPADNMDLPGGGRCHELFVADNGIGFPQELAEQAFIIFERLHEGSRYAGTGIGLALCRKIVDNHNGQISVTSEEGAGTTFRILLPEKQGEKVGSMC